MTKEEKEELNQWFKKANHDLIAAHKLIEECPDILDTVCFHCQQASEKYLKAYLIFKGIEIERTHNLEKLKTLCVTFDNAFNTLDFKNLNYFAVDVRYPDDVAEPDISETEYYLEIAEKVKEMVLKRIPPFL